MNSFVKSIAAIAAVAATTFAAGPAQASELTYGQSQLLDSLDTAGVTYDVGECEAGVNGWHLPSNKHIRICDSAYNPWQTMRHEAVHAAQHCHNGLQDTMLAHNELTRISSDDDWSFIKQAYTAQDWGVELEAFTLMRESNETIANIVNKVCN